ncbi:MAG: ribonuclease G [Arenicella sp.]|jgi:ribonuclease G
MASEQEILINVTPHETRVAAVEDGIVQELYVERIGARGIVGNIYKGKVVRVLPGMQAAFVDIGLDKNGFLHAADIVYAKPGVAPQISSAINADIGVGPRPIQDLVHQGQTVWVQVIKDPIVDKGARLSTELTVPSRNLVYMPNGCEIGISQKIESRAERARLRSLVENLMEANSMPGGFIVRTLAESAHDEDIANDLGFVQRLWAHTSQAMKTAKSASLVHQDLPLTLRILRDLSSDHLVSIRIDSKQAADSALDFARDLIPEMAEKIECYTGSEPLFELYCVEKQIAGALQAKVMLKNGGDLVIDQTHAMTTIDVNTGSYVGRKDHQQTILKTNLEAASEIAHQLRLRGSGGIIIIDFIDMLRARDQQLVLSALERELALDRVKTSISQLSPLGLVEVTRKRTRESLQQIMCETCEVCEGSGMVKTVQTVCYEILREILRESRQYKAGGYTVIASSKVVHHLREQQSCSLDELQKLLERPIKLKVDSLFTQQQYDIALS